MVRNIAVAKRAASAAVREAREVPPAIIPAKLEVKEEPEEELPNEELEDEHVAELNAEQESGEDDENEYAEEDGDEIEGQDEEAPDAADNEGSNGEPDETAISKSASDEAAGTSINFDKIPDHLPAEQVVFVKNMPMKTKGNEIAALFQQFGSIHTVKRIPLTLSRGINAYIGFNSADAAKAAIEASGKLVLRGYALIVEPKQTKPFIKKEAPVEGAKQRTIYVRNIKMGTTKDQLEEHFSSCGTIEKVNLVLKRRFAFAFIVFSKNEEAEAAKVLNHSVLNGISIHVILHNEKTEDAHIKDVNRTIIMKNNSNLDEFPLEKIQSIFGKCGEIEIADILCKKNVLAFVTFKEDEGAIKALELNGTTVDGVELELQKYEGHVDKPKTKIYVQNIKQGVTEDELRELFSKSGEIDHIFMKTGFAIIDYKDVEGFCHSFLLNESVLQDQMIFIEPHSDKKQHMLKRLNQPFPQKKQQKKFSPQKQKQNPNIQIQKLKQQQQQLQAITQHLLQQQEMMPAALPVNRKRPMRSNKPNNFGSKKFKNGRI